MSADPDPWPAVAVEIGRRLRRLREQAGMSQERLAQLAGLSRNHLQILEAGHGNPRARTLYGLAVALQVPVADLLPELERPGSGPSS